MGTVPTIAASVTGATSVTRVASAAELKPRGRGRTEARAAALAAALLPAIACSPAGTIEPFAAAPAPASAPAPATASAAGSAPGYVLKEIRGGVYWLSDGAYNTIFVVSSRGVIAVDPLPTLGRRYLEAVARVTRQPITHIVYSHEHTDHIGAAALFPHSAAIVAQRETAALLARRQDPRRPVPTIAFDDRYVLEVGEQTLVLEYKGPNHSPGNLFIYAPRQKVLMLVDVVYPGYMPYPGLGVASDVPGYIAAHRQALAYDFTDFVGGHVDRIGTRADVERSMEFVADLRQVAEELLAQRPFPAFLAQHGESAGHGRSSEPGESAVRGEVAVQGEHGRRGGAGFSPWFAHDDYETDRVSACYDRLLPKWSALLAGAERSLRSHCRSMIVALAIQLPPIRSAADPAPRSDR